MYFDAFTISALVDEMLDTLVGGRIQDVLDVDATGFGMEIYADHKRQYLYLSADKQLPRIHVVGDKLRRGLQRPTTLGLLLRRYAEGGRIVHMSQPPWERILDLELESPEGVFHLIVEPMERRSNILLVRDGIILDCVHRVGPDENRFRLSLPQHEYKLPPPMTDRIDPLTLTLADLERIIAANDDPKRKTANLLTSHILGMSPLLAKEAVYLACGNVNQKVSEADVTTLHAKITTLVQPLGKRQWQIGIAESEADGIQAYSVYPITHLSGWHPVDTLSEAMSAYYGAPVGAEAYAEAKKPVQAAIEEGKKKYRAKLASLESGLRDDSERELLQHSGQLILAYQYAIQPDQTELRAQYDFDQPELVIELDPKLTPLENAQRYFDEYNRAKRAQAGVPDLIDETRLQLNYLAQLENDLMTASNWLEIDDVIQTLYGQGLIKSKGNLKRLGGGGRTSPLKLTKDGYVIWVGRNSRQNEQVTFKVANATDLWLHARDVPGAHVVIRNDGRRIPERLIEMAASVAAYYSAKRDEARVVVDVTRCRYVKKIKGAGPGMVTYRNETTLTVAPHNEEILKDG